MTRPAERFRLHQVKGGASAEVSAWPLRLEGDLELCQRLSRYLASPAARLGEVVDQRTGERATGVVTLQPGDPGWLGERLSSAAQDLGLQLSELPLSQR